MLTKDDALNIAKKLHAEIKKQSTHHDYACIYEAGQLVAKFGIRRGSNRNQGHGHIPSALKVRPRQAQDLAHCPMSRAEWIEWMQEKGYIAP
jgi:hypothetical protein